MSTVCYHQERCWAGDTCFAVRHGLSGTGLPKSELSGFERKRRRDGLRLIRYCLRFAHFDASGVHPSLSDEIRDRTRSLRRKFRQRRIRQWLNLH